MICPKCGTPNRASAKFCDECGYELPSVAPIANEMFDDESHVETCKPKSAPTADLAGVDKTNDSSFEEKKDVQEEPSDSATTEPSETKEPEEIEADKAETKPQEPVVSEENSSDITAKMPAIEGSAYSTDQKTYSVKSIAETKKAASKNSKNIAIALAVIAVLAAILGGTYCAQIWGGKVVPDVSNLSEAEAKTQLQAAGFQVETEQIASDEVEGIVISMEPGAGSRVAEGSKVLLDISMRRVVPNVVGMSIDDAKQVMQKSGFKNVDYATQKSDGEENRVLTISPEVDTPITADAKITVTVSEAYRVPDVSGLGKDEAVAKITEAGFAAKTVNVNDETKTEGTVLSTTPEKDSVAKSGSEVTVSVCLHRSTQLEQLTRDFFAATYHFVIGGKNYEIGKLTAVEWTSGGTVAYTITARQYQTTNWLDGETETRYLDYETIQGTLAFDDNNNVYAGNPAIQQN